MLNSSSSLTALLPQKQVSLNHNNRLVSNQEDKKNLPQAKFPSMQPLEFFEKSGLVTSPLQRSGFQATINVAEVLEKLASLGLSSIPAVSRRNMTNVPTAIFSFEFFTKLLTSKLEAITSQHLKTGKSGISTTETEPFITASIRQLLGQFSAREQLVVLHSLKTTPLYGATATHLMDEQIQPRIMANQVKARQAMRASVLTDNTFSGITFTTLNQQVKSNIQLANEKNEKQVTAKNNILQLLNEAIFPSENNYTPDMADAGQLAFQQFLASEEPSHVYNLLGGSVGVKALKASALEVAPNKQFTKGFYDSAATWVAAPQFAELQSETWEEMLKESAGLISDSLKHMGQDDLTSSFNVNVGLVNQSATPNKTVKSLVQCEPLQKLLAQLKMGATSEDASAIATRVFNTLTNQQQHSFNSHFMLPLQGDRDEKKLVSILVHNMPKGKNIEHSKALAESFISVAKAFDRSLMETVGKETVSAFQTELNKVTQNPRVLFAMSNKTNSAVATLKGQNPLVPFLPDTVPAFMKLSLPDMLFVLNTTLGNTTQAGLSAFKLVENELKANTASPEKAKLFMDALLLDSPLSSKACIDKTTPAFLNGFRTALVEQVKTVEIVENSKVNKIATALGNGIVEVVKPPTQLAYSVGLFYPVVKAYHLAMLLNFPALGAFRAVGGSIKNTQKVAQKISSLLPKQVEKASTKATTILKQKQQQELLTPQSIIDGANYLAILQAAVKKASEANPEVVFKITEPRKYVQAVELNSLEVNLFAPQTFAFLKDLQQTQNINIKVKPNKQKGTTTITFIDKKSGAEYCVQPSLLANIGFFTQAGKAVVPSLRYEHADVSLSNVELSISPMTGEAALMTETQLREKFDLEVEKLLTGKGTFSEVSKQKTYQAKLGTITMPRLRNEGWIKKAIQLTSQQIDPPLWMSEAGAYCNENLNPIRDLKNAPEAILDALENLQTAIEKPFSALSHDYMKSRAEKEQRRYDLMETKQQLERLNEKKNTLK